MCVCVFACVCVCVYMYTYICIYTYVCLYVCMYVCMYVWLARCIHQSISIQCVCTKVYSESSKPHSESRA